MRLGILNALFQSWGICPIGKKTLFKTQSFSKAVKTLERSESSQKKLRTL
jgi:hypothetical protein